MNPGESTNAFEFVPFGPGSIHVRVDCAAETAAVQQALLHHSWWFVESASREAALERSPTLRAPRREGRPVVRDEAASGSVANVSQARKPRLRPHAGRKRAIPVSRRRSPLPRDFHPEIPARDVGVAVRLLLVSCAGGRGSFAGILEPCSRGFLHSTTFTGTPLDRASPSTSHRASIRRHLLP